MNELNHRDEVTLFQMFNAIRRYKWLILILPVVAALMAFLWVSVALRPVWEAATVLEIGHMSGKPTIEPISNVLARLNLPSFSTEAISRSGINVGELTDAKGFYGTLKVSQLKGSELIELRVQGASAEMAKNLIRGCVIYLQEVHGKQLRASMETKSKQLQILTADIQRMNAEAEVLKKKLLATHNWNAFDATLSATVLKDLSNELRSMYQSKLVLEEELDSSRSYNTRVIGDVDVSEGPVSPNKSLFVKFAALLGLFAAVIIAFVHNAITSSQHTS